MLITARFPTVSKFFTATAAALAMTAAGFTSGADEAATSSANQPISPAPTPTIRRLTRVEYANSLRDLLGIEFPFTAELPADGQAEGFDTIGDALSLSPLLLETYLKVARKASELAIGIGNTLPITQQFPAADTQSAWQEGMPLGTRGGALAKYYFPRSGEYELRAMLDNRLGVARRSTPLTPVEGVRVFRLRTNVSAGLHTFISTFPDQYAEPEGVVPNLDGPGGAGLGGPVDIRASAIRPAVQFWLDGKKIKTFDVQGPTIGEAAFEAQLGPPIMARVEITGPLNPDGKVETESRQRLLSCASKFRFKEKSCAKKMFATLARRAYRREVTADDLALIMAAYARKREAGNFDQAVAMGLRTLLMSPDFLFLVERPPSTIAPGQSYRLSDYELASRLSYFIWSSLPDEELLTQAANKRLQDPATLQAQVQRMLADPRSQALIDNFAVQWLGLRDFNTLRPDLNIYPEFDDGLSRAFDMETRLFLRSILRENRSVLEVLSSDYTFLNQRLAELYGIEGVEGPAFRRVALNGHEQRGGVLTQGSVLMATSHAAQTSPILRGKWVLTNLLNSPPQPPPPGVPTLDLKPAADGRILTTREQIERHQISPVCVGCHAKMDPYGMALENFDVLGRWRSEENGSPIDASTALPRGKKFTGPSGLKEVLLARSNDFAKATTTRLMTYATGRRLEKVDQAAVKQIVEAAKSARFRFADLVIGVVNSAPFQMRTAPQATLAKLEQP